MLYIIHLGIFKPQPFLIIQSASHSFSYLYDTKKITNACKFLHDLKTCKCVNIFKKICSRHSYIFEKGLFNTAGRLPLLEGGAEYENSEE